jgi:hypothetical protein
VAKFLFRSLRGRLGQIKPEDIPAEKQELFVTWGRMDVIVYEGKRTDSFGHSYFASNPQVSSDLIQLIRYGTKPGEPGRPLLRAGPVIWRFHPEQ